MVAEAREAVEKAELELPNQQTPWAVLLEAFTLTFIAEWGDRTQLATIALAARYNPVGVVVGASLGHAICAAIAVIGGRIIAQRISERQLTFIGGCLFILFGIVAARKGVS